MTGLAEKNIQKLSPDDQPECPNAYAYRLFIIPSLQKAYKKWNSGERASLQAVRTFGQCLKVWNSPQNEKIRQPTPYNNQDYTFLDVRYPQ